MARVIKFRAWDGERLRYPTGDNVQAASAALLQTFEHVMQFTGLLDNGGREIYEGDKLLYNGVIGTIWYDDNAGRFDLRLDDNSPNGLDDLSEYALGNLIGSVVIGNIYECPDEKTVAVVPH